jgi:DNA-binding NarL/FixJ family response regulator
LRILVAHDHENISRGLKQLLTTKPGWEVCADAKDYLEVVTLAEQHEPDVVVMDISTSGLNGLEAVRRIREQLPVTDFVVLTSHLSDQLIQEVAEAGARGCIMKSDADRDLVAAVEAVSSWRTFFARQSGGMQPHIFRRRHLKSEADQENQGRLTVREREIVRLLAEGNTSKEVGAKLGISVKTAETHRANIMRKLEIHSVTQLVRYAMKNQIIEI